MSAIALTERIFDSSDSDTFFSLLVSEFSGKDFTLDDLKTNESIQEFVTISAKKKKASPKEPSPKKASTKKPLSKNSIERALESPDESRCQARVWAKGFGGQCAKSFVDGGCFCKSHQADVDENDSWWLCKITDPRPENPALPSHPDRVHKWRITESGEEILKEKKESVKKEQKSTKKEESVKKEKKPSVKELREKCEELGLETKGKKAELIERIESYEENPPQEEKVDEEVKEEEVVEEVKEEEVEEEVKEEVKEEEVEEEDMIKKITEEREKRLNLLTQKDSEGSEMDEITFEGVIYHMNDDKEVYDQYSNEMIGNWGKDSEAIEFLNDEHEEKHEEYKDEM